jgi:hypothetical protein
MKVYTKNEYGHKVVHYVYDASEYLRFRFHLLCEVGQPWQREAQEQLETLCKKTNSEVVTIELDHKPWLIDTLVKVKR